MSALAFLIGIGTLQLLPALPPKGPVWALLVACAVGWGWARHRGRGEVWARWAGITALGLAWALAAAHARLSSGIEPGFEGRDLLVSGQVRGLPQHLGRRVRFEFVVETVEPARAFHGKGPITVRLSSYGAVDPPKAGERWRLVVRLKRPRGLRNPGAFDYEAWLFARGIRATGYVRKDARNRRLSSPEPWSLAAQREALRERLARLTVDVPNAGFLPALVLGDRSAIPKAKWDLLLGTGTNHLLAISGLHVGMVGGLFGWLVAWLWRRVPALALRWAAPRAGAAAAVAAALLYAALAGWSVPTQRAFVMVLVVAGGMMLGRGLLSGRSLGLALVAVLVLDPFAVLSPGFWLSFGAVAIIAWTLPPGGDARGAWYRAGRVTLLVGLGLVPLTLWFFQRTAVWAPLANFWAIPLVGMVTVPLALLGAVTGLVWAPAGHGLLWLAGGSLELLWPVLNGIRALPGAVWFGAPSLAAVAAALVGLAWLLAPRGWPARAVGVVLLVPLLVSAGGGAVPHGQWRAVMLDVGQGLSVIVQTAAHVLVFDTGPRFSARFDAGEAAVVPALRHLGVRALDTVVVSHGDNDHAGGLDAVLGAFPGAALWSADVEIASRPGAQRCRVGSSWTWDGVRFALIHPPADWRSGENDAACVLRISAPMGSLLLASDVERMAEARLSALEGIGSDVLQVPHHGSRTSSTSDFLDSVRPTLALVSVGYRNRWGFPKPEVLTRYRRRGIEVLDTASSGAIWVGLGEAGAPAVLRRERLDGRRYWTTLP